MKTDKFHFFALGAFVALFPFCVGGYYSFYCALGGVYLALTLIISIFRKQGAAVCRDFTLIVISLMTVAYLLTKFWAVDKTMSLYGLVKMLVPFLFMFNLYQVEKEDRQKLLYILPPAAAVMTAGTFLLGQISSLHSRFFDNMDDLHGCFEYANTFALYLLAAALIAVFKPKDNKKLAALDIFCAVICALGIYLSRSRAVWLVGAGVILIGVISFVYSKTKEKIAKPAFFGSIAIIAAAVIIFGAVTGLFGRAYHYAMTDSSVVERLLFWHDAFIYALHHPFGKGAYAFYYVQPQIQSAYYYVIDVHNDYIQYMVEIGIVPALTFVALIVKQLLSREVPFVNKLVILAISLHAFVDYDLQFASVFAILLLCFEYKNEAFYEIKSKLIPVVVMGAVLVFEVLLGLSSYYNYLGHQLKSNYYYKNTSAMVILMHSTNQQQQGYELATDILENNDCVFEANRVLSAIYAENKRYDEALEQMELVLKKEPRNMENYEAYIDLCVAAQEEYKLRGENEKAEKCAKNIAEIPSRLESLKKNTNEAAIKYGRSQEFKTDEEHSKIIDKYIL